LGSIPPPVEATHTNEKPVDDAVVQSTAPPEDPEPEPAPSEPPVPRLDSRRIAAVFLAGLGALVIIVFVLRSTRPRVEPPRIEPVRTVTTIIVPPAVTPEADSAPAASAPPPEREKSVIVIETSPAKATVVLEGAVMGVTPVELSLEKKSEPVEVEIRRSGYQTVKERVVPDMNQRLRLNLVAVPTAAPPAPARAPAPSATGPYHRFD
jgi:hypothetical protein